MNLKESILNHLVKTIDDKCLSIYSNIEDITESRNSEDKSSAGDKHETGRAMVEIELNNLKAQLSKANQSKQELQKIKLDRKTDVIGFGNLVETTQGTYFIAIGLGKIEIKDREYFAISADSPIGQLILGKKKGDTISFRNNDIRIENIL